VSKWLVPLVVGLVACGLLVGFLSRTSMESGDVAVIAEPSAVESPDMAAVPYTLPGSWDGLSLGRFLERASGALVVRHPETVTSLGLGDALGIGDDRLTPLTVAYERETQALEAAILERLEIYDLEDVSAVDRLDARVYGWFLADLVAGHPFADHDYLVNPFITSYPETLERFLVATHPVRNDGDALDYITRLSQLALRYDELIERLTRSEAIGAIPPRFILEETLGELKASASVEAQDSPLHASFAQRMADAGFAGFRREELLARAERVIEEEVLPSYARLSDHVEGLIDRASEEGGVWRHADGDAYYAHLLKHYTTTDLTAEEIHAIGLAEVERICGEIDTLAIELDLGEGLSLVELYSRLSEETGTVSGEETAVLCRDLLEEMAERIEPVFERTPSQDVVVVSGSTDAFYSPGSLDGSRPGLFYAPTAVETPLHEIPTLVYHEAIPGHHFQIALAHESDVAVYRSGLSFTAYAEGWALYAERLASELGAYEDDPAGDLGRLQGELFRAVRLVVDTGIHAFRWTYEQAVDYMLENTGMEKDFVRREIVRYIVLPGQATAYKIGMLEMLELRDRVEAALGEDFELSEFHDRVLREGSVPLEILEELIDAYVAEASSEP